MCHTEALARYRIVISSMCKHFFRTEKILLFNLADIVFKFIIFRKSQILKNPKNEMYLEKSHNEIRESEHVLARITGN